MTGPRRGRGFRPMRDLPVIVWLLAAVVVALVHPFVPAPRWLMIHLLMLGAVSHAVLVWSRYFTDALLHSPDDDQTAQDRRLVLLDVGALAVVVGVPSDLWLLVCAGATAVAVAVLWHGWSILRRLRAALPSRFGPSVRYYVAAAGFLPVGAALGVVLARGLGERRHERLMVAHEAVNLLGWVGLTVVGTLVTLWPTMLRTRIAEGAERAAARALPVLVGSVALLAAGAAAGLRVVAVAGLAGYVVGLLLHAPTFVDAVRRKPPAELPAWSVLAGVTWLLGTLVALGVGMAVAPTWQDVHAVVDRLTPFLVAGFAAQVLLGALSYLVPVALGGGPRAVRAANRVLDRAAPLRLVVANLGLVLCLLPAPGAVRVAASSLTLVALAVTIPLLLVAVRASRRAREAPLEERPARTPGQATGLAATGVAVVALAVAVGLALDPAAVGANDVTSAAAGVTPTGRTTTVTVRAHDMRFTPDRVTVPAGDRLVLVVTNTDHETVHDLVLETGADSGRLAPGRTARVDVGVVGRDLDGWCSVLGHRQRGMVLTVDAVGGRARHDAPAEGHHTGSATSRLDLAARPSPGWSPRDAALPPVPPGRVHRRTFVVRDVVREVAPGVTQRLWTYDGTAPGPVLHGRIGDRFVIRLVNRGTVGHSIDFHAGELAPQRPMRTIAPGHALTYRFRATRAGIWMYHCSSMPMSAHIANGLFGAVVIEPPGLPAVARSYVLVQSELYLGPDGAEADADKVAAEAPDLVAFNGYADQYDHAPLRARVGERVRVWVLDAGPSRPTSFHVVGAQFDTTYAEGAYLLRGGPGGAQSIGLLPAQGGFVELSFPEPGDYPFVSHLLVDAERGAHGLFRVRPAAARGSAGRR
ncbi:multicopper oxidase domain-containing protein [Nocardioides marmoribigeumensis]|uniref:Copper-containing nitrite reductase n=1 Tax=Nocardioides marmoribigeumensis TaxID=433649 RepID=A0ABU2BTW1_9ACTN|nr:multicopper oxidase domain-containing protein [Nocardioides marmoribigeumensis]MDR7362052.1 nitrite reductase (NO-forming) [Nocardioides marmoribigeumensis]